MVLDGVQKYGKLSFGPSRGVREREGEGKGVWCQNMRQWNGISSGGRKALFPPSLQACQAGREKLTITQEENHSPGP